MTDYKIFRDNLAKIRAVRCMSAEEVAIKAGLKHKKRVYDIEEGRLPPKLEDVCAICKLFEVSIDDMLYKETLVSIKF
jgi:DNA-binding XRE family transcriptional regulator